MDRTFNFVENLPELVQLESETFEDGKRLYTLPDGSKVPSVTTILGHFEKAGIDRWKKSIGEKEAGFIHEGREDSAGIKANAVVKM